MPRPPKPNSIIAQVPGSGTAPVEPANAIIEVLVPVGARNSGAEKVNVLPVTDNVPLNPLLTNAAPSKNPERLEVNVIKKADDPEL